MNRLIFIALALFFASQPTQSTDTLLPAEVTAMLKKHRIPLQAVSLELKQINQSTPVLSVNPQTSRNPASVMKLVTTLAALELLGPTFIWKTRYFIDGALNNGKLQGNLILKGGGDPYLITEQFRHQLRALRSRGLKTISGDLVIDDSTFDVGQRDRAVFDGQPDRVYNVVPSASIVNFSATRVLLVPRQDQLRIVIDPPAANLKIVNRITPTNSPCRSRWSRWAYKLEKSGNKTLLEFHGKYSAKCGESEFTRAFLSNRDYTYGVFKTMWENFGGTLKGRVRYDHTPVGAELFLEAESKPLTEVITGTNKFSNNIMARELLLTIGKQLFGEPGTPHAGAMAVKQWLHSEGVAMPKLVIENGAGLSRISRVSAHGLSNLLKRGWESTYRPEFLSSLSIAAMDGTMRKRLRKDAPAGRIRIKTGLLNQTRAMAGYVNSPAGNQYTVAMLMNHPKVNYWSGNQVQDALLRWIMRH